MVTGLSFALMKPRDSLTYLERNSTNSIPSTNKREKEEKPLKPKKSGKLSLKVKLKPEHLTSSIKIMLTVRATRNI
jgi:hypothetical protein